MELFPLQGFIIRPTEEVNIGRQAVSFSTFTQPEVPPLQSQQSFCCLPLAQAAGTAAQRLAVMNE